MPETKKRDYELFSVRIIDFESDSSRNVDKVIPRKYLKYAECFIDDWCKEQNFREGELLLRVYLPKNRDDDLEFEIDEVIKEDPNQ